MSKNDYPKTRKPTATVKCPHCSHTGSARGLFTHVRLAHPSIIEKPKTATKIVAHPYDVNGLGHVKEKIHRLDKKKQDDWVTELTAKVLEMVLIKLEVLPSKGYKPATLGSIEPKKKRKYYGE